MNNTLTRRVIITNIFALFSGTAISQVALALVLFLTARALGTNAYGQYVACFALTKITAIIFNLGMDTWLLREGRRSHTPLGNLVGSNISIKLFMGGIWFLGIIFVSRYLNHSTYPPGLLYITAIATWLEATINTAIFAFNANLRNKITASITISSSVTLLIITLLLTYNQLTDVMVFAYARLVIAFITAGVAFWWLSKEIKLGTNQITIRRIVNGTFPFMLSDALLLIYTQADLIIIAYYLGTVATGLYSTASGMIRALFIVPQAVHVVMVPIFGQLLIENYLLFKKTFQKMSLTMVFIGAGLWIALAILGPLLILFILGEDFIASIEVLLILTPILYIKSISHAMAAFIVAVGYQKFRVAIQGVVAGLNVGLNILIINSFGINGVAWVYVISELILLVGYMILVCRWQVIARDKVLTPQKVNGHDKSSLINYDMDKQTEVLIINLHSSKNAGDAALALTAVDLLQRNFPDAHITLSMNDPESHPGEIQKVGSFMRSFQSITEQKEMKWNWLSVVRLVLSSLLSALILRTSNRRYYFFVTPDEKSFLQAYLNADLIASAPGNFLYSSGKYGFSLIVSLYTMAYSLIIGKPLYILPQSIGPFRHRWEQRLTNTVLRKARLVFVRETESMQRLNSSGFSHQNCHQVPDLAFSFQGSPKNKARDWLESHDVDVDIDRPLLGITTINWAAQSDSFEKQHNYEQAIAEVSRFFIKNMNGHVILFTQVYGATIAADDRIPAQRVAKLIDDISDQVTFIAESPSPDILKTAYSFMHVFVGTRMHSNIFALSSGIPVIAIAYRHKTQGLMRSLDLNHWVIDINEVNTENLINLFEELWTCRDKLKPEISKSVTILQDNTEQTGRLIAADFHSLKR